MIRVSADVLACLNFNAFIYISLEMIRVKPGNNTIDQAPEFLVRDQRPAATGGGAGDNSAQHTRTAVVCQRPAHRD